MYKAELVKVDVPPEESIDDYKYRGSHRASLLRDDYFTLRLKHLHHLDVDDLSIHNLKANGLKKGPMSAHLLQSLGAPRYLHLDKLGVYVNGIFDSHFSENSNLDRPKDEEVRPPLKYTEGEPGLVTVKKYERNPKARQACIEAKGSVCVCCGFDASVVYGLSFMGKIHVHHIRPISQRGKEYEVDPQIDLAPVCPNCHMITHSKDPEYTIDEMKQILKKF